MMICINLVPAFRINCLNLLSLCKNKLTSLFQKTTLQSSVPPASLSNLKIKLGGVENTGFSCTFSVMLQEFAAAPNYYDSFFTDPLQRGTSETDNRFALRGTLQKRLLGHIQAIREGKTVPKADIKELSVLLKSLGWKGDISPSLWHLLLHQLAPSIFPSTLPDPHEVYGSIINFLLEGQESLHHNTHLLKQNAPKDTNGLKQASATDINAFLQNQSISLQEQLAQKIHQNLPKNSLWKILDPIVQGSLEEQFKINDHQFSLNFALEFQKTHVVAYRKLENMWVCCNDDRITAVVSPPTKNLYAVIYECRAP